MAGRALKIGHYSVRSAVLNRLYVLVKTVASKPSDHEALRDLENLTNLIMDEAEKWGSLEDELEG